jgi:hypothetical protein
MKNGSAPLWSEKPTSVRWRKVPGSRASTAAPHSPAPRPAIRLPIRNVGTTASVPKTAGATSRALATSWSEGDPSPATSAAVAMIWS